MTEDEQFDEECKEQFKNYYEVLEVVKNELAKSRAARQKIQLTEQELETLQKKIVREHWFPHTEQFGHLEYMCQYTIEGVEYLLHKKTLMDTEGFVLKSLDSND